MFDVSGVEVKELRVRAASLAMLAGDEVKEFVVGVEVEKVQLRREMSGSDADHSNGRSPGRGRRAFPMNLPERHCIFSAFP